MGRISLFALCFLIAAPAVSGTPPITLHLSPLVGYRPLTVQARIVVEPDYLNRHVCVAWIGESLEGLACWQVEGQYAARVHYYLIKQLPAGDYHVLAYVVRVRDTIKSIQQTVRVIDSPF